MKRRIWPGLLLTLLLCCALMSASAAPRYRSTQAFIQTLEQSGVAYTLHAVDEDGDEPVIIGAKVDGVPMSINCYVERSGDSAAVYVWYVAEYPADRLDTVLQACSRLNARDWGVCFYADEEDHTVTASMDLLFAPEDAGAVMLQAVQTLQEALPVARTALAEALKPTATPTAAPMPSVTATPTVTRAPAVTATPAVTRALTVTATPTVTRAPAVTADAPGEEGGFTVVVTAESARIYAGPSKASPYVASVRRGERFPALALTRGFYIVEYRGKYVFISEDAAAAE